ncbi:hypothetical protein [Rhodopila sp.]|uniref:hypothetical protein n=1 Tax=Rhodopila sp. TaxID=2480087 RepID=UPI002BC07BB5|nr:hypothetical protein [Rhodopila sp.]HVZ10533.1 hypothetical protein [Rhodopila sp.]
MRRRWFLTAMMTPPLLAQPRRAAGADPPGSAVPIPDDFTFIVEKLEAVRAAVDRRALTLMTIVGPMTASSAAKDPSLTYPAVLASRLKAAWPDVRVQSGLLPIARMEAALFQASLAAGLSQKTPNLVIWGVGGTAAARGDDLASFHIQLADAIATTRSAGADMILMTPQYAPVVARLMNLPPYRDAVLKEAQEAAVPVLDRYELMRYWSDNGILDLDAQTQTAQISVAHTANTWIARLLADGIVKAVA